MLNSWMPASAKSSWEKGSKFLYEQSLHRCLVERLLCHTEAVEQRSERHSRGLDSKGKKSHLSPWRKELQVLMVQQHLQHCDGQRPLHPITWKAIRNGSRMLLLQQPQRDSNPQSSDPKSDTLSIRPRTSRAKGGRNTQEPDCCRFLHEATILLAPSHSSPGRRPSAEVSSCSDEVHKLQQQLLFSNTFHRQPHGEQDRRADLHPGAGGPPQSSHRVLPDVELSQTLTAC